nr:DUF4169 family protein [Mesorhizobium sp.]
MGEVVNLRLARKRKARAEHDAKATANRALHGRSKSEKIAETTSRQRGEALLDGHRLGKPDENGQQ